MRYELSDSEWGVIKPMLPNKPRGIPRVDDRRILNGIFWVLRSGAPWRDLPDGYGPHTTCYNRFVRWRRAGVWDRIMDALTAAHDAAVQMIDTSIIRVHQQAACIANNRASILVALVAASGAIGTTSAILEPVPLAVKNSAPYKSSRKPLEHKRSEVNDMSVVCRSEQPERMEIVGNRRKIS